MLFKLEYLPNSLTPSSYSLRSNKYHPKKDYKYIGLLLLINNCNEIFGSLKLMTSGSNWNPILLPSLEKQQSTADNKRNTKINVNRQKISGFSCNSQHESMKGKE